MELPIVDIKGKELGKLILTDEVVDILKQTGVDLYVEYNSEKTSVIAYLK